MLIIMCYFGIYKTSNITTIKKSKRTLYKKAILFPLNPLLESKTSGLTQKQD